MNTEYVVIRIRMLVVVVVASLLAPCESDAGPLVDWLFRRNNRTPSNPYAAAYQAGINPANSGSSGVGLPVIGAPPLGSAAASGNTVPPDSLGTGTLGSYAGTAGYAPAFGAQGVTAGYAPGATCGTGFCQQTVVQYVPQIAYRTAYEPVPVTTYKTSTSINPANGLPLTCTRPCTSYSYQMRRVPYTTYRPVYTTVPVTDVAASQGAPVLPNTAPPIAPTSAWAPATQLPTTAMYAPAPTYAYQAPGALTSPSCPTCQGGGATPSAGYGYLPPTANYYAGATSGTPHTAGYTPGSAVAYPPAPSSQSHVAGATPWAPVNSADSGATPWTPRSQPSEAATSDWGTYRNDYRPLDYESSRASTTDPQGATPWQPVTGEPTVAPSPADSESEYADSPPSLLGQRQQMMRPIESDRLPRRLFQTPGSNVAGRESSETQQSGDRTSGFRPSPYSRPELQEPANSPPEIEDSGFRRFQSRAIRDLERTRARVGVPETTISPNDPTAMHRGRREPAQKTASANTSAREWGSTASTPSSQVERSERRTRYTAVPIQWPPQGTRSSSSIRSPARRSTSSWVPIQETSSNDGRSSGSVWQPIR